MTNILALPQVELVVEVFTNEDWNDALAFYDLDGNPIILEGISFAMEARHQVEDATAMIGITNDPMDDKTGGEIILDYNVLQIHVPFSKMLLVPWGGYVFDVVGNADGIQRVIMTGTMTVVEGVTR